MLKYVWSVDEAGATLKITLSHDQISFFNPKVFGRVMSCKSKGILKRRCLIFTKNDGIVLRFGFEVYLHTLNQTSVTVRFGFPQTYRVYL